MNLDYKEPTRECLIKGNAVAYDACSTSMLYKARGFYNPEIFKYIGSGRTYYINGTENKSKRVHHFFRKVNYIDWQ